ncbi:MAG TPA: thiamine pyrophosphate-binding protein [Burkholderiales bacterium]|jgi:acetolactate synthase-1/2/3 large subunit|nr:thiamine pyrophosphate-binding protein [Burkholderiales bacterium]
MAKMSGSRLFAEVIHGYGVTHVFYVPTILMRALAEMDEFKIHKIMTHGEKAAAYMADGYARASGKPGVCMAQQIGASNLAAGLRDGFMACSPMIAISGGSVPGSRYRHAYQEVEDFNQFDAVTKFSAQVDDVKRLPDLMRQAFRAATTGAPGPAHLRLSGLHGGSIGDAEADLSPLIEEQFKQVPAFRPEPEPARVREALAVLAKAQRPMIVAGGGVVSSGAQAELVQFAEKLQIPVTTSLNAKAAMLDKNPLNVGVAGVYSRSCANKALAEADLVFFIGSHTGGQLTTSWKVPEPGVTVIQLDIDPEELGRNYPNAVSLIGDAKVTLRHLIDAASKPSAGAQAWLGRVQALVAEWRAAAEPLMTSNAVPMRPERVCREISEALPADGVVVSDTGHSGMWTGQMIEFNNPRQGFVRCAGSLGWGLPGAIGVKCALPDRAVVCFTGDGGAYYHLAELETAARYGINLVVVVNNNSSLNQEIPLVNAAYKGKDAERSGEIWRFQKSVDFAKLGEALGCAAFRVDKPGQLKELLPKAFAMNRPVVIDVVTDENALAEKAWTPGGAGGH